MELAWYTVPGDHFVCGQRAKVVLYCDREDLLPEHHFDDAETVQQVRADYNAGNVWAWGHYRLSVSVELGLETLTEEDQLGGCSYDSPQAFVTPGEGYYADMLRQCSERLEDRIDAIRRQLIGGE